MDLPAIYEAPLTSNGEYMTRTLFILALLALIAGSVQAQIGAPSVTKMGNGLTLILREDHTTELVGVDVWVKAGSANETAEINGVSHFIEHMVFGPTAKRQAGDADLEMESVGATLDAHTSDDWAHFSTTVSSRYLPQALDVLADSLTAAQFPEADVQRERLVILDEIAKKQADQVRVCRDCLAAELYGSHLYGLPVEGSAGSVRKLKRQDIVDYYHKYYVPRNMAIVLVGDVDMQRATAEVGRAFQGLASAPNPPPPAEQVVPIAKQINKSIRAAFKSTYVAVGFQGPPGTEYQDVCATDAMLSYLGNGYRSWMAEELKDKMSLATRVSSHFLTQKQPGMIGLIVETEEANIAKVKGALFAKIGAMRNEGIPSGSLELAKRSELGEFAFQSETCGGRANCLGFYYAVSEPEFAAKYTACLQSVTNDDIIKAAQKYLDPDKAVVLVIGPNQGGER